ncbi:putative short chain dehydrogenase reductase protein [Phaeoacremonium minimum UCRPA7]|uniref:Putative short chain dehydrogenase reductase protein n=1 Tax=Phaeoacremonium minimum (strain UCR-PA7) TaxID=1286976 RepID=R8BYH3_PHAM7|nr:putative short chain dehydrogenase reductase protein [Phaeoacremonium minimum UCRPA7]EOO04441.1 putative short chain dehydrogenase reductase protein [Phaeoacremonium minimum UCRPA7]
MSFVSKIVTAAGYGLLASLSARFLQFLYIHLRPSSISKYGKKHRLYKPSSRTWALVTGASDGLGVAWAHELSKSGFNVIIHGRNPAKLNKLKAEIEEKHHVQVRTLVIDSGREPVAFDEASYAAFNKAVQDATADVPLTVLINNIGIIGNWYAMADTPADVVDDSININVRFSMQLTRALLPTLTRNAPALIINVSSQSDASPVAYATLYTGAKGWGQAFHRSLRYEMRDTRQDVEVLTVVYGFIATTSTGRTDKDAQFGVATPSVAARAALNKVGCGYSIVTPLWQHHVQQWLVGLFPIGVSESIVANVMLEQKEKMVALAKSK